MSSEKLVVQKLCNRLEAQLPAQADKKARSIFVTSAHRREGKSFIAAAIAVQLSKIGPGSVLLVDANFDNPALQPGFKLPRETKGLYDCLVADKFEKSDAVKPGASEFYVLPAGQKIDTGVLFNQVLLRNFLDRAGSLFQWIVFDGGSLSNSGGNGLLHVTGGVVLVVDSGSTRRQVIQDALQHVELAEERVLGVVLNRRRFEIPSFVYRWI